MKHIILTLGIFSLGFLTSCDNTSEAEVKEAQEHEHHDEAHDHDAEKHHEHADDEEHAHHQDDNKPISLNNGEKWKVNEEMKPYIKEGETLVINLYDGGREDYKEAAEELTDINNQLISSCTMEGQSHDELHKWLYNHLELTKKLKEAANNQKEAQEVVKVLIESYEEFHKYFK